MGHGKLLTEKEKRLIEAYKQSGLSIRGIGRQISRSEKSIRNFLNAASGNAPKKRKLRKSKFSESIKRKILRDASNSTSSVRKMAGSKNGEMSKPAVHRLLSCAGHIVKQKMVKAPRLTQTITIWQKLYVV